MASLTMADMASRTMAEGKKSKWIQKGASKHPGLFRKKAEAAGKTTREFASEHAGDSGKLGKEARFAENAMGAAKKARRKVMYDHSRSSRD